MTTQEMHEAFDLKMDKHDNSWFNDDEKDEFLNWAQVQFVKDQHDSFESSEKARTALYKLVRSIKIPNTRVIDIATLIPDYMYLLSMGAEWVNTCYKNGLKTRAIRAVQIDDHEEMQRDPFNNPIDDDPYYLQETVFGSSNSVFNIYCDTIPNAINLRYLKIPNSLNLALNADSELHESVHEEIVDLAVRKAMIPTQDDMYQAQSIEVKDQES